MRTPERKLTMAKYWDIFQSKGDKLISENLISELVKESFPMNKTRKLHYRAVLQLQAKNSRLSV